MGKLDFLQNSDEKLNVTKQIEDLILPQVIHIDLMRQCINFYNMKMGTALCIPSLCSAEMVRKLADIMLATNNLKTISQYDLE
jgi:hypothetical protein